MATSQTINIPKNAQHRLSELHKFSDLEFKKLLKVLEAVPPNAYVPRFVQSVIENASADSADIAAFVRELLNLYAVRSLREMSVADFAHTISTSLKNSEAQTPDAAQLNWQQFTTRLDQLLRFDKTVGITAKSADIIVQHERVYCNGITRILTDARPIYGEDVKDVPTTAVILHTLKLAYHQDDEVRSVFVALDSNDLQELKKIIERAESKEDSLKIALSKSGIVNLSLESEQ